jgi:hypothetical protein
MGCFLGLSLFVIASVAKQSSFAKEKLDCFVALLLAMTVLRSRACDAPYTPPG